MEFRRARLTDLPQIVRLLADDALGATREQYADPLPQAYRDAFAAIERSDSTELIVADDKGCVVGCLQLTVTPNLSLMGTTRGEIEGVRVAAEQRGKGLGEAMLRHAIARARARGCGLVQLTTNRQRPDAQRFYEKLGFVPSHVGMKLKLDEQVVEMASTNQR